MQRTQGCGLELHTQLWEDPGAGFLHLSVPKYYSKIQDPKARGRACPRGRERGRVTPSHRQTKARRLVPAFRGPGPQVHLSP